MRLFSFLAGSILAMAGCTAGLTGIASDSFKLVAIGIILIMTAGVFATLALATRTPKT